ncbi:hypothetical protein VOLCADRAFT_91432 [Volvox carteri f. nagariensis]|uniref:Uncharacterized protein n=1 Tax=Volvox carteri f. nagariensis TaxID=3068 RepID=D8TX25_VOLCA|nr:uncharacterized protein VOLCADRAFT_91432 [Volvox carteri f. nagariensis]EFJ47934.1 hypothetical protein VOLCADRAFT_91432 [Volvox carteri f. nagariensis]|eukprot:XP_002951040.1 hypothetical protein VOLCADRAFT_91432 [Volvox carteri f. nagariensis]
MSNKGRRMSNLTKREDAVGLSKAEAQTPSNLRSTERMLNICAIYQRTHTSANRATLSLRILPPPGFVIQPPSGIQPLVRARCRIIPPPLFCDSIYRSSCRSGPHDEGHDG